MFSSTDPINTDGNTKDAGALLSALLPDPRLLRLLQAPLGATAGSAPSSVALNLLPGTPPPASSLHPGALAVTLNAPMRSPADASRAVALINAASGEDLTGAVLGVVAAAKGWEYPGNFTGGALAGSVKTVTFTLKRTWWQYLSQMWAYAMALPVPIVTGITVGLLCCLLCCFMALRKRCGRKKEEAKVAPLATKGKVERPMALEVEDPQEEEEVGTTTGRHRTRASEPHARSLEDAPSAAWEEQEQEQEVEEAEGQRQYRPTRRGLVLPEKRGRAAGAPQRRPAWEAQEEEEELAALARGYQGPALPVSAARQKPRVRQPPKSFFLQAKRGMDEDLVAYAQRVREKGTLAGGKRGLRAEPLPQLRVQRRAAGEEFAAEEADAWEAPQERPAYLHRSQEQEAWAGQAQEYQRSRGLGVSPFPRGPLRAPRRPTASRGLEDS